MSPDLFYSYEGFLLKKYTLLVLYKLLKIIEIKILKALKKTGLVLLPGSGFK